MLLLSMKRIKNTKNNFEIKSSHQVNYNDINPTNVNPAIWGPIFWSLLNTIAKNSNHLPLQLESPLRNLVLTIPYILPCDECKNHCIEIYARLNLANTVSIKTFKKWVWTLKYEVNRNTGSANITFNDYLSRLNNASISKKQIIDLFSYISLNYPYFHDNESQNKRNNVFIFITNLCVILSRVQELKSLSMFVPTSVWNNRTEFQNWIGSKFWTIYKHKYQIGDLKI